MKDKPGYTPKRMEEIFLSDIVVPDFFCGAGFLERMYQRHGKKKFVAFVNRQPFEKDPEIERLIMLNTELRCGPLKRNP